MYCAVIGDIISSKLIKEREKTQDNLKKILDEINLKYDSLIAARFTITLGDEFQGLMRSPDKLIEAIDIIKSKIYPVRLRIGIGIGSIDTKIDKNAALGADGSAYHNAREAISSIKQSKHRYQQPQHGIKLCSGELHDYFEDELFNSIFVLCNSIENNWTDKQRNLVWDTQFYQKTQRELAKEYGINQSSIQRRLKASNYYAYKYAIDNIQNSLIVKWEKYR